MDKFAVTIVCLTYNNPTEFHETFESILHATDSVEVPVEILIVDSSTPNIAIINQKLIDTVDFHSSISCRYAHLAPSGIYQAMNYALDNSSGLYINFMNSGDTFAFDFNLSVVTFMITKLLAEDMSVDTYPYLIYGRTCIQSCTISLEYLNPPSNVIPSRRFLWNKIIPPGHQACFFLRSWHLLNYYSIDAGHSADRFIILRSLPKSVFMDTIFCNFRLSGMSSLNHLKPINYFRVFLNLRAPIIIVGFWPKVLLKHIFGKHWEIFRKLRLQLLSYLIF